MRYNSAQTIDLTDINQSPNWTQIKLLLFKLRKDKGE